MNNKGFFSAKRITWLAILIALVVVLQAWGSLIPIGATRLSCLVLVPIVIGSIVLGPVAGLILGLVFGVVVLCVALFGGDPFTAYLLQGSPVMTLLIIFVKGGLAGLVPGLAYKALAKCKKPVLATFVASALAPIMNTGVFVLGTLIISGVIEGYMAANAIIGQSAVYFIIIVCAGVNFLIELAVNVVLSPALYRVIKTVGGTVNDDTVEDFSDGEDENSQSEEQNKGE